VTTIALAGLALGMRVAGQEGAAQVTEELLNPVKGKIVKGTFAISFVGAHLAWGEARGRKCRMLIDGQVGPEYDGISFVVFSPDGKRLAYAATRGREGFVVVDGKEGPKYPGLALGSEPTFRPDGSVEYVAAKDDGFYRVVQR